MPIIGVLLAWAVGSTIALFKKARRAEVPLPLPSPTEAKLQSALDLARLRYALDQHSIVAVTDRNGIITYVNDRFCEVSKYSREELIGQPHRIVNSGHHGPEFWREFWQTIVRGEVWRGEVCNRAKDGGLYWVEATVVPFFDASGVITEFVAIRTDITSAKNLALLHESVIETSQNGVMVFRAIRETSGSIIDFACTMANRRAEAIFGVEPNQLLGKHAVSMMSDRAKQVLLPAMLSVTEGGGPLELEYDFLLSSGTRAWYSLALVKLGDGFAGTFSEISARKESESAAKESEARFRLFVDQAPTAIAMFDTKMCYIAVSQQWMVDYGLEGQSVIGRCHYEVFPEIGEDWKAIHRQCLQGVTESRDDDPFERADGTLQWLRWNVRPWRNSRGEIGGLLMFTADVTAQVQVRHEVQRVRDQLEATLQAIPDLLFEVDIHGRILGYRTPQASLLALPESQFLGRTIHETLPESAAARIQSAITQASIHGVSLGNQYELDVPAGTRWFELSVARRTTVEGEAQQFVAVARDITGRKHAEQSLVMARAAEEQVRRQLQDVIDAATQVSIISGNPDGLITLFNSGAEQMLGYTAAEMVGIHTPEIIHLASEVVERGQELSIQYGREISGFAVFAEPAKQGLFENREWTYVHKSGRHIQVSLVVTAMRNALGEITGYLGIAVDITARKQAESALVQARDKALEATRAKSAFLANMSHEIRTPLNGVIGVAGLMADTPMTREQEGYIRTIRASGQHLLDLINDVLDFSKIEAGHLELETIDFNLRVALEDVAAALAFRASERSLTLTWSIAADVPLLLRGDPSRLRQVLLNLVSNALKFTTEGGVSMVVTLADEEESQTTLRFEVHDSGIGVEPERCADLFNPFTQADASTTRRYGGTGLGLAISRQIVEVMNGTIGVESELGSGSIFWFTAQFARQLSPTAPVHTSQLHGHRILVIESHRPDGERTLSLLSERGAKVRHAETHEDALSCILDMSRRREGYDAVLVTDQGDPEALEALAERIRQLDLDRMPSLLVVSHLGIKGDAAHFAAAGYDAYLSHPFNESQLLDCLVQLIARGDNGNRHSPGTPLLTRHTLREEKAIHRILLVEDNAVNQLVARGVLGKMGYVVETAVNGQEALDALTHHAFDLVLMDCQMPVMDGYEATRTIRDLNSPVQNHAVPIVAMTANAMAEDRELCLQAGMNDYVSKPIRPEILRETLARWLPTRNA